MSVVSSRRVPAASTRLVTAPTWPRLAVRLSKPASSACRSLVPSDAVSLDGQVGRERAQRGQQAGEDVVAGHVDLHAHARADLAHDGRGVALVGVAGGGGVGRRVGLRAAEDVAPVVGAVERGLGLFGELVDLLLDRLAPGVGGRAVGRLERELAHVLDDLAQRAQRAVGGVEPAARLVDGGAVGAGRLELVVEAHGALGAQRIVGGLLDALAAGDLALGGRQALLHAAQVGEDVALRHARGDAHG